MPQEIEERWAKAWYDENLFRAENSGNPRVAGTAQPRFSIALPPPNREALSQIPFLMPHAEREPIVSDGVNASNSAAVDEVVRRVLEKLQPQLHELLSQGVKPLVENMLQNELKAELHKNEK